MTNKTVDFAKVKSYVEGVEFQGLFVTNEEYLKTIIGNEIFKSRNFEEILENVDRVRKRLIKLGCFKSVEAVVDGSKSSSKSYQVIFDVEEMGSIGGGIHTSVGNNDGSLSSSIYFPNIFGKGERLSGEYTYGTRNHVDSRISYTSPIGFNPDKQFSISLFSSSNDFPWSKYHHRDNGISIDIFNPYSLTVGKKEVTGTHMFSYEGSWRHLHSFADSTFDVREQSGHTMKSSLKYSNIIDRRDHKALPTKGGYLRSSVELAGLGGDVRFFRFNTNYQYSRTFYKYFTTQVSLAKGFIVPTRKNETISLNDRFFLGGPLNLRGFVNRGAGFHKEDCSLGNDAYWLFGAHLYTPLPFLHKHEKLSSWLKTHSFVNIGNLMSVNELITPGQNRLELLTKDIRMSIGTGVVIAFGNIARVELNYVWPLRKGATDKAIDGLQFGIGIDFN